jgi:predicted DCC family thiol-disulfide oxidoreductase YuxK
MDMAAVPDAIFPNRQADAGRPARRKPRAAVAVRVTEPPLDDPRALPDGPVLLFDGVCRLCHAWARFVLRHDRRRRFRLATLQSPAAAELLGRMGRPGDVPASLDSMRVIANGRVYARSEAGLQILRLLPWPWRAGLMFRLIPRRWRDALYDWVGRHRYRWFGRHLACPVPGPRDRARFLPGGW